MLPGLRVPALTSTYIRPAPLDEDGHAETVTQAADELFYMVAP